MLAPATVALTFGSGQSVGTFGPLCKTPVTATATVTGVTGYATPSGNVTLTLKAADLSLHPAYTITVQTVRLPFLSHNFASRLAAKYLEYSFQMIFAIGHAIAPSFVSQQ